MRKLLAIFLIIPLLVVVSTGLSAEQEKTAEKKDSAAGEKSKTLHKKQAKYTGKPGDFFFRDADLQNVLIYFARTYKFNIVIDPGISGKVTCSLRQVPWDQALSVILKQHGLAMKQNGNIVSVINPGKLK